MGAIVTCEPAENQFLSPFFLVPKPNGSKRFILNLKKLNQFVNTSHFKLEDLRSVLKLVFKDYFLCNVDLKDAYFLVPVSDSSRKFLRFKFKGQLYKFTCLPFGLCTAPYVFTQLLKPVLHWLRQRGMISTAYLDDILCIGNSFQSCLDNVTATRRLLSKLGFIINEEKSSNNPERCCKYLGFIINSNEMSLSLTPEKKNNIKRVAQEFLLKDHCQIRELAALIGSLIAAGPGIPYGMLYTKCLEREKLKALIMCDQDFDQTMTINNIIKGELTWWVNKLPGAKCPIRSFRFAKEIFSDASMRGWGAHFNGQNAQGFWTCAERSLHINRLELKAAFLALKCFAQDSENQEILLRIDNTTTIAYINRMGGVQYPELNRLARDIWQWCEERQIWIFASYIPSRENTEADRESRKINVDTEWELGDCFFNKITNIWGRPRIDLFATRINAKADKFCAWRRDPDAFCIDAFTLD